MKKIILLKKQIVWTAILLVLSFSAGYSLRSYEVRQEYNWLNTGYAALTPIQPTSTCDRPEIEFDNVLIKVNEYRLENKQKELGVSLTLSKYAQARAEEIESTGNYNHQTTLGDFRTWEKKNATKEERYDLKGYGELLVRERTDTCQSIEAFKVSPTHNASLLDQKYSLIGVGVKNSTVVLELGEQ